MRITRIEAISLLRRLDQPFMGGTYEVTNRNTLVTRVYTDAGIIGEAFGGDEDRNQHRIVALIRDHLAPRLIGEDARDVERLWEAMFFSDVDLGNRGLHVHDLANRAILMQAIAAIDVALWDAIGKLYQTPLYKLLGGYRDRVPVIAIGGYYYAGDTDHQQLRDEVQQLRASQLAGIKLKVGRAPLAEDVARTQAVREAGGPDFVVACDANQAWTPAQAIAYCQAVAPLGIRWIEEPVRWHDQLDGLRAVREGQPLPVVAGQGEITRWGCRDLIIHGRVNILNTDVTVAGGITEWRRVAALASVFDVQMAHHEESQVALHLLAAIPHGLYVEMFSGPHRDPFFYELPKEPRVIQNGHMLLPDGAGLGMELNEEVVARYAES